MGPEQATSSAGRAPAPTREALPNLRISDRFIRVLAAGILILALAGAWVVVSVHALPDYPGRDAFAEVFRLNSELSVPTWYSSVLLFIAAGLLTLIAWLTRLERGPMARRWAGLALIFAYVSMDEVASVRDRYLGYLSPFPEQGILFYGWVVPGALLVFLLALAYARFVFRLPVPVRRLAVIAAAIFVGGALGLELVEGALAADARGPGTLSFDVIAGVEEVLENVGALVLIVALLRYIRLRHPGAHLTFDQDVAELDQGSAAAGLGRSAVVTR